jgi:hypothetical protein
LTTAGAGGEFNGSERRDDGMTAILTAISRTIVSVTGADVAKHALLLAAACAFVFLLSLTHGLDLSAGFF